ncbi:MAG: uroporphyrinogen decarboxylase family protein [Lachnospiraceae bacterium]
MLTKKQNLRETIRGGNPDRFVNQYEYLTLLFDPTTLASLGSCPKGSTAKNGWGVTIEFPEYVPGPFPVTSPELVVVKDIANWQDYVKAPEYIFPEEAWAPFVAAAEAVDKEETFAAPFIAPGIFEKLHYLIGMEEAMIALYEEPEAMHALVDYLTEYEIHCAGEIISHLHPDALFHHDDWGSQISSFLSPEMFGEFIAPAYKKIYGFWKENGVELIVHHSDSYAANLVPHMIDSGIDIWQGVMSTNHVADLIQQYGGQISFHAGIDNGKIDRADWTKEKVMAAVREACEANGKLYYIPGTTMGGPESTFPGLYEAVSEAIDEMSKIMF